MTALELQANIRTAAQRMAAGIPYPSAVTLIRPEDVGKFPLPPNWGSWDDAEIFWEA